MVAYGATLRRARRPGWEDAYLCYTELRELLEEIDALCKESATPGITLPPGYDPNESAVDALEEKFLSLLRKEIEKVSLFSLTRQGEIAEAVGALRFESNDANLSIQPSLSRLQVQQYRRTVDNGGDDIEDIPNSDSYGEEAALLPRGSIERGPLKTPKLTSSKTADISPSRPMFRPDTEMGVRTNTVNDYTIIGVELLHLLKFICVNAMGVRKILKKHDKIMLKCEQVFSENDDQVDDRSKSDRNRLAGGPEDHLQQLANSSSVAAIYASLLAELVDLEAAEMNVRVEDVYKAMDHGDAGKMLADQTQTFPTSLVRFKCTVSSIHTLRLYAQRVNRRFQEFLSSKAMILTGNDPGGLERSSQKALSLLIRFQPDSLLLMDEAALEDWNRRIVARAGEPEDDDASLGDLHMGSDSWGGVSSASMVINLMSTLLYTVNYYIAAPTANHYAILLGTDGAFGATLIGASSFAAIFAAFLYSLWYSKGSFRSALLFSSLSPCVGNLLYAVAISYGSMSLAVWGRILVGFGSAEVINRQIISACVSFHNMTKACALFVAASAIGMSLGPLLAAILDITTGHDIDVDLPLPFMPKGGIIYNHVTSPAFVMACLWFLEILALIFVFHEPERINGSNEFSSGGGGGSLASFESEPNLSKYGTVATIVDTEDSAPTLAQTRAWWKRYWSQLVHIKDLIFFQAALPVTLLLFGFIELVDEVLISSCSMVCRRYFSWNGSTAGFLVAALGSLVLPAHYVVELASRQYSERRIMKLSILFILVSLFAILNYEGLIFDVMGVAAETVSAGTDSIKSVKHGTEISIGGTNVVKILNKEHEVPYDWGAGKAVYITFLSAIFMGTIILEGVDTSIMAKTTPAGLNDTFMNSGLLATLVGTVGRVVGDSMITLSALVDQDVFTDFVNATFFPMIPLALLGYFIVKRVYQSLLSV